MIQAGKNKIEINLEWQKSPKGEMFKLYSIIKGSKSKWVDRVEKFNWYYVFRYENGSFFSFHQDLNDEITEKFNHNKTIRICSKI